RTSKKFTEVAYPSAKADVWYGTEAIDGRHLFLFDRGGAGVIKWDSQTDTGKVIPWPYKTPFPGGGRYEPRDKALWCHVWDFTGGKYKPPGIARMDIKENQLRLHLQLGKFMDEELFPQLKEIGIEVVVQNKLPQVDDAYNEFVRDQKKARSADKIK